MDKFFSTAEVAKSIGVHKKTLLRWLYAGEIKEPQKANFGHVDARLWASDDVERAKTYKEQHYRKRS